MTKQAGRGGHSGRPVLLLALALLLGGLGLGGPAGAAAAPRTQRDAGAAVSWLAPTPDEGAVITVSAGASLSVPVRVGTVEGDASIHLDAVGLPRGAGFMTTDGDPAEATLSWTPGAEAGGDHPVLVVAAHVGAEEATLSRAFVIRVVAESPPGSSTFVLSEGGVARWATVMRATPARSGPNAAAPVITRVGTMTPQGTRNVLMLLDGVRQPDGRVWLHVRLAIRPNNITGWVDRAALGELATVHTHLVVNRARLTATLFRDGSPVFRTSVGVGRPQWPTPAGEFYVRVKQTGFFDPFFGPIAFGTSARSMALLDWPGGGFIGIHGTSMPWLLPGRVSHGCIRMRNDAILRLAQLMPVGTPVTIV